MKAKAILRDLGHSEADSGREYKDWHIDVRSGQAWVSVWTSDGMVFLSLSDKPVFYVPGAWESYLDRLFHRSEASDQVIEQSLTTRLREKFLESLEASTDS